VNLDFLSQEVEVKAVRAPGGDVDPRSVSAIESQGEQPLASAESDSVRVVVLYRDEKLLRRFLSGRRLKRSTRGVYRAAVRSFNTLVGVPLEEAGRPEFREWYVRASSRGLEASTISSYAARLKRVLEYALADQGHSRRDARERAAEAMEEIPVVDLRREQRHRRSGREKLVSPEEFDALLGEARHPRALGLVAVLRESGCRKGELLSLRVRDVEFKPTHAEIRVLGKTGERTIPLVRSVGYLKAWLDAHPDPRPGTPLFATVWRGEVRRMDGNTPNRLLRDLCRRAGLRPIHPHMLRHTRLTELAVAGVGEYVLKSFAGWTSDSKAASWYIHLSGRTHIPTILRLEGKVLEEAGQEAEG